MKIDLHVHIHRTSHCARADIDDMAQAAIAVGLQGIVVLDHNYQATSEECNRSMANFPIKIFRGAELCVNDDDVILISPEPMNFLPPYRTKFRDVDFLSKWCSTPGNLAVLAHPYRRSSQISWDLAKFRPHAIEIASNHVAKENRRKINDLAKEYSMNCVATSDAHKTRHLGGYCIDVDRLVNNELELATAVKGGNYTPMEKVFGPVVIIDLDKIEAPKEKPS